MLRFWYTLLSYCIQPLILLFMWKKSLKQPNYRKRLSERYGIYPHFTKPTPNGIIVHAASVGEVIAATPLIKAIQVRYPKLPITITTVTPTGSARVKDAFGESVSHFYLPYDLPDAINRFIDFVQPKLMIVIETELWPNLIARFHQRNIPFIVANARLSPRSAKRYGWIKCALKGTWQRINMILAQDKVSEQRYLDLGYPHEKLVNTGNLKFDLEITKHLREKVFETVEALNVSKRLVWIAGSTHEGEEKIILNAHQELLKKHPDLLLILVPRHPERFNQVEELIQKSGLSYKKRSQFEPLEQTIQVLLGDTMGEMMVLYGLAEIAFVGGSLVKHGGHNPLEPIAFELPVISGVHTYNLPEIFAKLRSVHGVIEIESSAVALAQTVAFLLENRNAREKIARYGFEVLKENQGALARHLHLLAPYLEK
ncbi:3-deoxy-D-manno-octulosonic acid transferase [Haemophilus parahaemolyticus]|uniref:3-deoxy-D-manno-octulosonic acid transferase n=2 Tax=Haemophilus parahaemolyticus TaxID=735 RepID=A0AAE6JRR0_HAEPH|nr:lipid IV(A) 3-deoxy-D-manno-octulosonic acid transferase [Haemophilus parahaemolyticus]EIJ73493.1 3-deoxy-D-manno-octulosonic-acid transferase [Haemophilus parahaemolyticus HK385]OOR97859.1 3-deoxy-D-manno-octulosonic acid transferase [Haemophilus parahaemolyticus]QEN10241.1 3-deoxy-D-manno-octulosonic acid transferase [Haemophilus parahaemolyticus]QRP13228.1 lipid IV(A) 3-deoxy-D-manno-octulosonic acid transferase [Haemophilus parahaemolyticus]STO65901.1 3-deoxy-D-manno-octulosonic-acid tr